LNLARTKATEFINDGKRRSDQIVTDAKERAGSILTDAEKMLNDAREKAEEESARVKSAFRAGSDQFKSEKRS
jgi:vacuolar-type H+-ATPase subunit H